MSTLVKTDEPVLHELRSLGGGGGEVIATRLLTVDQARGRNVGYSGYRWVPSSREAPKGASVGAGRRARS